MGKKAAKIEALPEVKNGKSINDLIKEINSVIGEWVDTYKPILAGKDKTLKACGLEKTPGATIKTALLGAILAMISDLNMSLDDLKKCITITKEEPYIKFSVADKYVAMFEAI